MQAELPLERGSFFVFVCHKEETKDDKMSIYDTLNEKQKEAVFQTEGPVLILAGAGSGKTRVIIHRIAYLLDRCGVNPWNVMAITFTNKAAGEMRERVNKLVGYGAESIWVSTFHSTCVRILRRYIEHLGYSDHFAIYDTDDQKTIMKDICKKLNIDTKQTKERTILSAISSAKDELITPEEYAMQTMGDFSKKKIADAYREYQETLKKNNALDFDDLIVKTVELFKANPDILESYQKRFQYVMVDEYQDTNTAQFELIRLLSGESHNLCVVGDDDQSIYKFRGANIHNILDFEKMYPQAKLIKLEQNYRSTQTILDAANAVIHNNQERKEKALWTDQGAGNKIHFRNLDTAYEEAEFIVDDINRKCRQSKLEYGDFAILYRTNAQARILEERFVLDGTPYEVVGGTNFYSRKEIKDILSYLKTVDNGQDDIAVKRVINVPKRGIGATTIEKVQIYADENEISFYDALRQAEQIDTIGKSFVKLQPFVTLIQGFRGKLEYYSLKDLIRDILDKTGYLEDLKTSGEEDAEDRINNVEELVSKITAYEESAQEASLSGFLEEVALVADVDSLKQDDNHVLLMTLHSAKGLEFPHVYLAGMEDGVFPSYMTIVSDDTSDIEEERRLAYVGITRAKEDLTICYARSRMIRGETQANPVSRFVREIPPLLLDGSLPASRKDRSSIEDNDDFSFDTKDQFSGFGSGPSEKSSYRKVSFQETAGGTRSLSFQGTRNADQSTAKKSTAYGVGQGRPIQKIHRTPEKNKPYLIKGVKSLNTISGLTKGMTQKPVAAGSLDYQPGDRVRHIKYGEGTVTAMEPGPRDCQVTVTFDEAGQRVMYAAFAKLKKI